MYVRGSGRWRDVVSLEVVEADVIADYVLGAVEGELVKPGGTLETASRCGAVYDLLRGGLHLVVGRESEGRTDANRVANRDRSDRGSGTSSGRIIWEIFAGARGILGEILARSLGISHLSPVNRAPTACESVSEAR